MADGDVFVTARRVDKCGVFDHPFAGFIGPAGDGGDLEPRHICRCESERRGSNTAK